MHEMLVMIENTEEVNRLKVMVIYRKSRIVGVFVDV